MTSLQMVKHARQRGLLTKAGAAAALRAREALLQEAFAKAAADFARAVLGAEKTAGLLSMIGGAAKKTGLGEAGANLAKMVGIAGLSAGASAGAGALLRRRRDRALQGDIQRSYQEMFDRVDLSGLEKDRINTHFGVLARFAPSLAADPTVAGSFVHASAMQKLIEPETIRMLTETQRRIDEMREGHSSIGDHFDRGLDLAQKALKQ